jgi:hypothetical protein
MIMRLHFLYALSLMGPTLLSGSEVETPTAESVTVSEPLVGLIADDHTHPWHVDWAAVDGFPDLVRASDLVVRGRVLDQRPAVLRSGGKPGAEVGEIPLTISPVEIDQLVRDRPTARALGGARPNSGQTIEIVELGGVLPDGCFSQPEDKPILAADEEVVLFLATAERTGAYHIVGGWQGHMRIRNGVVHTLASDVHPDANEFARFTDRPAAELLRAIQDSR